MCQTNISFVAVTQCDKQKFCLSQWLSATNKKFVCRSDSVRQTKNFFVAVTQCDKQKNPLSQWLSATNKKILCCSDSVRQTKKSFVAVTQCDKQKNPLSQWLSATNKKILCRSDSVRQTIYKTKSISFVTCDKEIGKNAKNKHHTKFEFHHRYQIALGYLYYD